MKLKSILLTAFALLGVTYSAYNQTPGNGMIDIDGNNYSTVIIGDQEWMSENLRVSKYDNGDNIPNIVDNSTWNGLTTGAFCWYNHNNGYDAAYGKLYNWFTTVDSRSLCPSGWRVPSDNDFAALISYLDANANNSVNGIESTIAGGLLKESGTSHWNSPNVDATNSTGFSARGTGSRSWWDFDPNFGEGTLFWTTNQGQSWEGISRWVQRGSGNSGRGFNTKESGFSVRCMKDYQGCYNDLNITPAINNINIGDIASFVATTSDANPNYIWQSDFGQGFQTLNNFGNYSGANTATLNIVNVQLPNHTQTIRVISTSGICIDTSNVAVINILDTCITNVTVYDTLLTTVTDTLVINTQITGINPTNNLNTLKVYPNPASTHITIDFGNFNAMSGYTLTIVNSIGQTVFTTPINQQTSYIDLSTWTGNGIYFVQLIDPQNNTIENRKIVIQ